MTTPFNKFLTPEMRWKTIALPVVIIACVALIGLQANRWLIASRTVTQAQIDAGWKAAGLELATHTIAQKENFWKVAKLYQVNIDSIIGANQGLAKLSVAAGQKIRVPNRRGVVHMIEEGESTETIAALYSVPVASFTALNNLQPKHILVPGLELFIPRAKPVRLSDEMTAQYGLRGIFGSPLPGRSTSGMGMRKHPVGGFRGRGDTRDWTLRHLRERASMLRQLARCSRLAKASISANSSSLAIRMHTLRSTDTAHRFLRLRERALKNGRSSPGSATPAASPAPTSTSRSERTAFLRTPSATCGRFDDLDHETSCFVTLIEPCDFSTEKLLSRALVRPVFN